MLKIKTNINNCYTRYVDINDISMEYLSNDNHDLIKIVANNHLLNTNDIIQFYRKDGENIKFSDDISINKIIDENTFLINKPKQYILHPYSYEFVYDKNSLNGVDVNDLNGSVRISGATIEYIKLLFNNDNKHIFLTNRDNVKIRGTYQWDYYTKCYCDDESGVTECAEYNGSGYCSNYIIADESGNTGEFNYYGGRNLCSGDFILRDDTFLHRIEEDGSESQILNNTGITIVCTYLDSTKNFDLINCIVPINRLGDDNPNELLIPYNDNIGNIETFLGEYRFDIILRCDDTRFLYNINDSGSTELFVFGLNKKDGTTLNKKIGDIEVDLGLGNDIALNLNQDEILNELYVDSKINRNINDIIDYEKYPYVPMFHDAQYVTPDRGDTYCDYLNKHCDEIDKDLKLINEIQFNMAFRCRSFTQEQPGTGGTIPYYGSWSIDDAEFWNMFDIDSNGNKLKKRFKIKLQSDFLGFLGFTDDDIFYQRDSLKKSFLRLSFYDSPRRETQKLLYYSTIYFDTNDLLSKYLKIVRDNPREESELAYGQYVFSDVHISGTTPDGTEKDYLTARMGCTDKLDERGGADGFYLHMFKLTSGNTVGTIYMKCEFNNAKNGRVVPLMCPLTNDFHMVNPTVNNTTFPISFMEKIVSGNDNSFVVNTDKLNDCMYTKVFVKYNYKTNSFTYFFPKEMMVSNTNILRLNLYEPRINDNYTDYNNN